MKQRSLFLTVLLVCGLLSATILAPPSAAQPADEPAAESAAQVPPEHASARATLRTFLQAFDPQYQKPGTNPLDVAAGCLDLSGLSASVRQVEGREIALDLKEILDRTALIVFEDIPDDPEAEPFSIPIHPPALENPGTVVIAPDASGAWLVSRETIEYVPEMLERVRGRKIVEGVVREGPRTIARSLRERMPATLKEVGFLLEYWQWVGLFVLIMLGVIVDRLVILVMRVLARRVLAGWIKELDVAALHRDLRPAGLVAAALLWWPGITWLGLPVEVLTVLAVAVRFVAATAAVWMVYRLVDVVAKVLEVRAKRTQSKLDDLLVPLVRKTLKVFIVAFGLIFIADNLEVPITSLLAGVSLGGLAIALAAQDAVKNLFGSLTVILDHPFHVGDWVAIGDVEGVVTEVGFRSTRIRTFYDSLVTLPNSNLINASVDNYGARKFRRWSTKLDIAYSTPPDRVEAFCEGIRELIRRHPGTRKDYFEVHFNEFGPHSLKIMLYMFFDVPDWSAELRERHRFGLEILSLAAELGVEFAFPTQTLHLHRHEPPGSAVTSPTLAKDP